MVGTAGLEPATSASRTLRATKLRYVPICDDVRRPLGWLFKTITASGLWSQKTRFEAARAL